MTSEAGLVFAGVEYRLTLSGWKWLLAGTCSEWCDTSCGVYLQVLIGGGELDGIVMIVYGM